MSDSEPVNPASSVPSLAAHEISPEIQKKTQDIYNNWQKGDLAFQDALNQYAELKQTITRPADLARIEIQSGIMQGYRGNYDSSIDHFERARELGIQINNRALIARCAMNIGETYRLKGNFARARQYFQASYEAAVAIGLKSLQVIARSNEGQMLISQGRYDQAEALLLEQHKLSLDPWEEAENDTNYRRRIEQLSEICGALARLYVESAKPQSAWTYAKDAIRYAEEIDIASSLGSAYRVMGVVLTGLGSSPDSTINGDPDEYFHRSSEAFREVKADGEIARTLHAHGKSLGIRGKKPEAVRKLQQATIIFTRLGMVDDAGRAAQDQLKLL